MRSLLSLLALVAVSHAFSIQRPAAARSALSMTVEAVETKENVKVEAATQTYATITLQNYFRMYVMGELGQKPLF